MAFKVRDLMIQMQPAQYHGKGRGRRGTADGCGCTFRNPGTCVEFTIADTCDFCSVSCAITLVQGDNTTVGGCFCATFGTGPYGGGVTPTDCDSMTPPSCRPRRRRRRRKGDRSLAEIKMLETKLMEALAALRDERAPLTGADADEEF